VAIAVPFRSRSGGVLRLLAVEVDEVAGEGKVLCP
jgi:hypothetical protein